jgi:hypothetical protein
LRNMLESRLISFSLLLAILLILYLPLSLARRFDPDEFQHLHSARSIVHGKMVYQDFFEHHMPLQYALLVPLYSIFGDSLAYLIAARVLFLLILGITLWSVHFLACLIWDAASSASALAGMPFSHSAAPLIPVLFLSGNYIFANKAIEIRPDNLMTPLVLFGFSFLLIGINTHRTSYYLYSGVFSGLALFASVKAIFPSVASALIIVLFSRPKDGSWKIKDQLTSYLTGFLLIWLTGGLIMGLNHAYQSMIYYNFLLNASWEYAFSLLDALSEIAGNDPVMTGLFISAWVFGIQRLIFGSSALALSIITIGCSVILPLAALLISNPYLQNFLPALPFMAILSLFYLSFGKNIENANFSIRTYRMWFALSIAGSWFWIFRQLGEDNFRASPVFHLHLISISLCVAGFLFAEFKQNRYTLLCAVILLLFWPLVHPFYTKFSSNFRQLSEIEFVTSIVPDDETILDDWSGYGVLRDHAAYFSFLHIGVLEQFQKDLPGIMRSVIENNPPRMIRVDAHVLEKNLQILDLVKAKYHWRRQFNMWSYAGNSVATPDEDIKSKAGKRKQPMLKRDE